MRISHTVKMRDKAMAGILALVLMMNIAAPITAYADEADDIKEATPIVAQDDDAVVPEDESEATTPNSQVSDDKKADDSKANEVKDGSAEATVTPAATPTTSEDVNETNELIPTDETDSVEPGDEAAVDESAGTKQEAPADSSTGAEEAVATPEPSNDEGEGTVESYSSTYDNSGYVSRHSTNMTTEAFVASIGESARQVGQSRGIYASVMIAQAILESASGTSELAQAPYNNLFGIKGSYNGNSVNFLTHEGDGHGGTYAIHADFAAYDTTKDSLEHYADLLTVNMRDYYSGAFKENASTYVEACEYLEGRYATSEDYAENLISLIETYNLTRFDEALPYKVVGQIYDKELVIENADGSQTIGGMRDMTMDDYANLLATATAQLGIDYVWGGTTPQSGFDCSGLCMYSYAQALGINLPRTSYTQQYKGVEVSFDELRMGDLLFFDGGQGVHHVALYIGDGFYIQAPQSGDVVKVTAMEDYMPDFAKRILTFEDVAA